MFNGIHNLSKTKAFLVLYDLRFHKGDIEGLGVSELHNRSGVDYDYLRTKLSRWAAWGYLKRKPVEGGNGRTTWAYTISAKGERFIRDVVLSDVLNQCVNEVKAHRAKLNRL